MSEGRKGGGLERGGGGGMTVEEEEGRESAGGAWEWRSDSRRVCSNRLTSSYKHIRTRSAREKN